MPIVAPTPENLARAAAIIRGGGVVAFPTETVYGLGANAFDARAVSQIFEIKRRPSFDPLIVHIVDEAMLARVALPLSDCARQLAFAFWPGPLTLVLAKSPALPELVTAGLGTVGVREPSNTVARALIVLSGAPIAAPSANRFGHLSPTRAEHVQAQLGNVVDMIIDGGACERGVESTIVMLEPTPTLLRHGAISVEEIELLTGPLARGVSDGAAPLAPGSLTHHYAPRTPLRVIDPHGVPHLQRSDAAALTFTEAVDGYADQRMLSPNADMREAAANLFTALHDLDARGLARIDAEPIPATGLGAAIMDRLQRAELGRAETKPA